MSFDVLEEDITLFADMSIEGKSDGLIGVHV